MHELLIAGLALATAGIPSLSTYFLMKRKNSGAIGTSTADRLWIEANQMRQELRDEVVKLRTEVDTLNNNNDKLRNDMQALREQLAVVKVSVDKNTEQLK